MIHLGPIEYVNEHDKKLRPGDRLIEIDGWNVEDKSRDEIVARIKTASNSLKLLVVPSSPIQEEDSVQSYTNKYVNYLFILTFNYTVLCFLSSSILLVVM